MFGYLRFVLANIVLLSHAGVGVSWGYMGACAVVMFYALSGYVITNLWDRKFSKLKQSFKHFYKDRFFRIYPLYILVLLIYIVVLFLFDLRNIELSFLKIVLNLLLIPCNYRNIIDVSLINDSWPIINPSWSLALEVQCYLLMPFVLRDLKVFVICTIGSLIIFLMANLSMLDKYNYGYFLLPGTFFIFIIGASFARDHTHWGYKFFNLFILVVSITGYFFIEFEFISRGGFQSEVLIGIVLSIIGIFILRNIRKLPGDREFAAVSYGVFLIHYLIIFIVKDLMFSDANNNIQTISIMAISIILSFILYFTYEKKITMWRYESFEKMLQNGQ